MRSNLALQIKNLSKIYNQNTSKENKALCDISLNIEKGSFFALLGPNGAGKSTLINCLSTIVKKTSGEVIISGYDLDTTPLLAKKAIGIVPQELNFDPFFTPLQSLMLQQGLYGITPDKTSCIKLLHNLGLTGKENSRIRTLSGGMKRRVLIAKALIHNPDIVILDEPTAGVDVELRRIIWQRLVEINKQGTTIILTTHYLEEAEILCKDIAIINKGQLIANDKIANLIHKIGTKALKISVKNMPKIIPTSIQSFISKKDKDTITFTYKNDTDNGLIINELTQNNIVITQIKSVEPDLEEVFLKLVDDNNVPVAH